MKKILFLLACIVTAFFGCRGTHNLTGTLVDKEATSIDGAPGTAYEVPSNIHSGTIYVEAKGFSITIYTYLGDENFDIYKHKGKYYEFKIDPDQ
jgi:hypothetical protein